MLDVPINTVVADKGPARRTPSVMAAAILRGPTLLEIRRPALRAADQAFIFHSAVGVPVVLQYT
jgi:hypothetical protein